MVIGERITIDNDKNHIILLVCLLRSSYLDDCFYRQLYNFYCVCGCIVYQGVRESARKKF